MSNNDKFQLICIAALTIVEAYSIQPWKYPVFAWFWDFIASFCGELANRLAFISMHARSNYYMAVNSGS